MPPEDGSCGQFAVQFHVTTTTVVGLKRIADARGVSVPELCRQVVGVFVAQQEGELGALLAAEAEVADYRPSLGQSSSRLPALGSAPTPPTNTEVTASFEFVT